MYEEKIEISLTLFGIGAVEFSIEWGYDCWKVWFYPVFSKIYCNSTKELEDACSLKRQHMFGQEFGS